jgi:hypothetical protein
VSSTPDPILLLEPSNLLEPLNLQDRHVDTVSRSARPIAPKNFGRTIRREPTSIGRDGRWPVRSALIVAGALACFGAGTAMPQLPALMFGDNEDSQTVARATRPSIPQADAPVKSAESRPAELRPNDPASNGSSQNAALGANAGASSPVNAPDRNASTADRSIPAAKEAAGDGATSCDQQAMLNNDTNCLAGGVATPATSPVRTAAPDRNSDSSPPGARPVPITTAPIAAKPRGAAQQAPVTANPPSADAQRTDARAYGRPEDRAPVHSTRPAQRDRAGERNVTDQQPAADDNAQTTSSSDRRQDRDVNRTSSRRRDRAARDTIPPPSLWGRRPDPDSDRASISRRDPDGDDADDRRVVGRMPREDDRTIGRAPRFQGPMTIFPFPNDW